MKTLLPLHLILMIVLQSQISNAQFGWIRIYDADTCGIVRFKHLKYNGIPRRDIYIQFGISPNPVNSVNAIYYTWSRLNKNTGTWVNRSHNSFIHSNPFYCKFPNSQGWKYYLVTDFLASPADTNLILEVRDVPYCGAGFAEPIQDTRITYNNGTSVTTLPQFGNGWIGNQCGGFDIDMVNDNVMYFAYPHPSSSVRLIWKSTDRGMNWFATDTVNFNPYGMLKINPLRRSDIFIAGPSLYKSTSSGYDFYPVASGTFYKIIFDLTDSSMYGITRFAGSGIFKSTNHGNNWSMVKQGLFWDIEINPDNHNVLYAGSDSGLYRSANGGAAWLLYNNSFTPSRRVIGISKDPGTGDTLYVSTNKAVYKVWGSWVGINPLTGQVPDAFALYQNYPNPFNPSTRIRFDNPPSPRSPRESGERGDRGGFILLVVYDVLGREVATLINEGLKPGTYEVEWDATNYPSGIYYYRLTAEDYSQTKKMALIK